MGIEDIQGRLDELTASGAERAVQVAVYRDGAPVLAADIPSEGKNTARALAALYSALIDGTLLPPAQLDEVSAVALTARDEVMGNDASWCLGFAAGRPGADTPGSFGLAGSGGTWAWADRGTATAVAVAKNLQTQNFDTAQRVGELV
ncbi:serine hydrolase [Dactylosporangium sp. CA-139066]